MNRFSRTTITQWLRGAPAYGLLLLLSVASRMASAIYYIEDPDSLRFALGVVDYDVARLQPHFPGYPAFCFPVKLLYLITGSYALGFAIVGGISVYIIIISLLRMLRLHPASLRGGMLAFIVFANPFIWLMSNRYMPDLMGAACVLWALALLLFGKEREHTSPDMPERAGGFRGIVARLGETGLGAFLAGLLMGIRLSYAPFVLLPLLFVAIRDRRNRMRNLGMLLAGITIWLVPLIALTGWNDLVAAAARQTSGHFEDFGGTVYSEPVMGLRLLKMTENIIADGLGGYWEMRHWITIPISAGLAITLVIGIRELARKGWRSAPWSVTLASILLYSIWILLFQNVIYQSRHILPIIPFLLVPVAIGSARLLRRKNIAGVLGVGIFLGMYATLAFILVRQHREPTAVARAKDHITMSDGPDMYIASVPLINYFLASQGVQGIFLSVHDPEQRKLLSRLPRNARLITVGDYRSLTGREPAREKTFYHNPFVNRVWPRVVVHEY